MLGVFQQSGLLQPQTINRLLQIGVLLPHVAQIHVVVPQSGDAGARRVQSFLRWRYQRIGPVTNQLDTASVAGIAAHLPACGAVHLHGKAQNLGHQQRQQHQQIPIPNDKGFHETSDQWSVNSGQIHQAVDPRG